MELTSAVVTAADCDEENKAQSTAAGNVSHAVGVPCNLLGTIDRAFCLFFFKCTIGKSVINKNISQHIHSWLNVWSKMSVFRILQQSRRQRRRIPVMHFDSDEMLFAQEIKFDRGRSPISTEHHLLVFGTDLHVTSPRSRFAIQTLPNKVFSAVPLSQTRSFYQTYVLCPQSSAL